MIISAIIVASVPLLILYGVWSLKIYALARLDVLILAVGWGGVTFFIGLGLGNTLISRVVNDAQAAMPLTIGIEEVIKVAFLVYLFNRRLLRYSIDGAVYGFAVGAGFSLIGNINLIITGIDDTTSNILIPVISNGLIHTLTCALLGTVLGINAYHNPSINLRFGVAAVSLVVILHILFNLIVGEVSDTLLILIALGVGLVSFALILWIVHWEFNQEREFISTQGETSPIKTSDDVIDRLRQYHGGLGEKHVQAFRNFIPLQAQYSYLADVLSKNQREAFTEILLRNLYSVERELQLIDQQIGLYTRIWLQRTLPIEGYPLLWDQLSGDVEKRHPIVALIQVLNTRQDEIPVGEWADRQKFLRDVPLFQDISDDDVVDLSILIKPISFPLGATVIEQGAVNDRLYFVRSGEILSSVSDDTGNETVLNTYTYGNTFGETGLLDEGRQAPALESIISEEGAALYYLERADFIRLLYGKPRIGLEMLRQMSSLIRQHTNLIAWIRQNDTVSTLTLPEVSLDDNLSQQDSHILIVDDAEANRLMLGDMLKHLNFQPEQAEDGIIALEMIEKNPPDLILLDIMMPRMDGFEVARRLKASAATADIPIIFLTAVDDDNRIIEGLTIGAVDYIIKPFQPREVMARINTHITIVRQKRTLIRQQELIQHLYERERLGSNE